MFNVFNSLQTKNMKSDSRQQCAEHTLFVRWKMKVDVRGYLSAIVMFETEDFGQTTFDF